MIPKAVGVRWTRRIGCLVQATKKAAEAAAKKVQEDLEAVIARHEADVGEWEASMANGNQQLSCRQQHLEVHTMFAHPACCAHDGHMCVSSCLSTR